jgi:hypothetical protein
MADSLKLKKPIATSRAKEINSWVDTSAKFTFGAEGGDATPTWPPVAIATPHCTAASAK